MGIINSRIWFNSNNSIVFQSYLTKGMKEINCNRIILKQICSFSITRITKNQIFTTDCICKFTSLTCIFNQSLAIFFVSKDLFLTAIPNRLHRWDNQFILISQLLCIFFSFFNMSIRMVHKETSWCNL